MGSPSNSIYIIQGEVSLVVTAMRRSSRWGSHSQRDDDADPLFSSFSQLKDILNNITDLTEIEPNAFLSPFLEVIRSEDTTGPITGLALTSVNKFLSYGLVDPSIEVAAPAIENIADAVTHARFVGTDPGSDEVVLMKILHVLRTLLLCPAGILLTNESVCEIMQSCFRICFEMRLSELLRKSAEHTLMDMVQLLFTRLPHFKEDPKWTANMKRLKMRTGGVDQARMGRRKKSPKPKPKKSKQGTGTNQNSGLGVSSPTSQTHGAPQDEEDVVDMAKQEGQQRETDMEQALREEVENFAESDNKEASGDASLSGSAGQLETVSEGGDSGVDPGVAYVHQSRESIATTPVEGTTIIDIVEGFRGAGETEDIEVIKHDPSKTDESCEGGNLDRTESNSDLKDHISLTIPDDDSLARSPSETSLPSLPQSEYWEEDSISSQPSMTESADTSVNKDDFVNPRGVRFIPPHGHAHEGSVPLIPYGLPCVRELFRFLISLTNPLDRHNTDVMIHMGLSLLTVALESGADHIGQFSSLVYLVKDDMCRYLFMLVQSERLSLAAAALRVCFLLFESIRSHLKFQLEMYLTRLSEIITSDHPRITYEVHELALEAIVQLWRIPGLVTELYLNYDCDLYCTNLFEDLTKLLSKNAFPVSGLFSTHLLSLDALLTVVDTIEQHCHTRILQATSSKPTEGGVKPEWSGVKVEGSEVEGQGQFRETNSEEKRGVGPPTTVFTTAHVGCVPLGKDVADVGKAKFREGRKGPYIKPNRMKVTEELPTIEKLTAFKQRKRVYNTGTEYFNQKPAKGIAYLQEQGLLHDPLDAIEVVTFIKENPKIDKKVLGEFVTKRNNSQLLEAFVKSFHFEDLRIDEALRQYLEAFRLPGEAPVISLVMEHFAEHWHKSNGEPFANADAAFTLGYAIIMLNVDQHNHNVKKQNIPMTVEQFKKNLKAINGGEDFESEMLVDIYNAIKTEEIVMPSEHSGLVRENYLWKVLLKRSGTKEGVFTHAPTGAFDHDLFTLIWGPTVAALSFVFDKSSEDSIIAKAVSGFRKCAMISAHYGMSDVFDNLVISLCKFTTLLSSVEQPENIPISFGMNTKAQLSAKTVFSLAHRHGDILREGWKNILDCMLQLYRAKLLPKCMTEVEDFLHQSKINLLKEESTGSNQRSEGVLSSFYSYFTLSESAGSKGPSPEDEEATKHASKCIQECKLEQLIIDSKFLREESLHELIKALIHASQGPESHDSMETNYDEDAAVFFFEQFITCILQNRDRVTPIWQSVRDHIYSLVVSAGHHTFMVERAVVGLLRISIRLLRREEIAPQVLASLQIMLMIKPEVIHSVHICQQVSYGLHDTLRTNAANIHDSGDWYTLFMLLEVVGAGVNPPPVLQVSSGVNVAEGLREAEAQSDSELPSSSSVISGSDRGYTSDSELETRNRLTSNNELEVRPVPENGSWMLVNKDEPLYKKLSPVNQYSIELNERVQFCDSKSLLKSSETLSFLVRDTAHITPLNFESCVHAIRAFSEASLNGGSKKSSNVPNRHTPDRKHGKHKVGKKHHQTSRMKKSNASQSHGYLNSSDEEGENDDKDAELHSLSIQLLDLMHTLHTRANSIYSSWAEEGHDGGQEVESVSLWIKCWCPLLQGIARLCCDARRQVRGQALTYLQRALLVHDLQTLSAVEWEACFNKILFPLLTKLLENINTQDPSGMEETRMRASTLLCKVFLQHLTPLLSLSTFTALWLTILEFMDKYMHTDRSDLLAEAIPESLKNMLLVMDTAGIFDMADDSNCQLWRLTWDRIGTFLPHLKEELFKPAEPEPSTKLAMDREETPTPDQESAPLLSGATTEQTGAPAEAKAEAADDRVSSASSPSPTSVARDNSCLATDQELPSASSYFLHTPLPTVPNSTPVVVATDKNSPVRGSPQGIPANNSRSPSDPMITPAVPLLLNPELMKGTGIHIVSPQVHMATKSSEVSPARHSMMTEGQYS